MSRTTLKVRLKRVPRSEEANLRSIQDLSQGYRDRGMVPEEADTLARLNVLDLNRDLTAEEELARTILDQKLHRLSVK